MTQAKALETHGSTGRTAAPATETVARCPLCGDEGAAEHLFPAWDRYYHLPGEFALVRCARCALVRLSPRPELARLDFYYPPGDYYSYQTPATSALGVSRGGRFARLRDGVRNSVLDALGYPVAPLARWQRTLQPLVVPLFRRPALYGDVSHHFPRYRPRGRALDVGCGNGSYLSYLKLHGWEVAGVELSAAAAEVAHREFGIEVFVGSLRDAPFDDASFDFIHLSHVIEHVPDPLEHLRLVARLLKPGGSVYLETPNVESFGAKRCGAYWFPWESPRHLCLFSPATLRRALDEAGLRVTRLSSAFFPSLYDWEDAYRREERERASSPDYKGAPKRLPNQPPPNLSSRGRARLLETASRLEHYLRRPLNGDILRCWAGKK